MGGAGLVRRENHGSVAVLVLDPKPVNTLSAGLCAALENALDEASAEPETGAIVIKSAARSFPIDARLAEGEADLVGTAVEALCARIDACTKPVVVALHGSALGAGLAVALAATARIATPSTRFGCPEVTLGLVPGAGTTQRLPRLIGGEEALRLMLTGRPVAAAEALAMGLLDRVVETGLDAAAVAFAEGLVEQAPPATRDRRDGLRDGLAFQKAIAAARARTAASHLPAPARIVDCVEAAQLLPFGMGLDFEHAAAEELGRSPEAAGLRHVFLAELRAAHFPETQQELHSEPAPIRRLGILGALADDLVLPALAAGLEVILVEPDRPRLVMALERIAAAQEKAVAEGRLTAARRDDDWARLGTATGAEALGDCAAVVVGDPALLPLAAQATAPGVMIGLAMPAEVLPEGREADVLGFRQGGNRFVEIAVGAGTAPDQVLAALALARQLGFTTLRTVAPGGVAARVMAAGRAAVAQVLAAGEQPAVVLAAMAEFGLAALAPQGGGGPAASVPRDRVERVVPRVLSAMANEGARMIEEGGAARPSDIDFALVAGAGFPRWRGGPMFWADQRGLLILRRDLSVWAWEAPELWTMAPLIGDLVASGRHFSDLDHG